MLGVVNHDQRYSSIFRPLGYARVYLPLDKVAATPFHIKGDDFITKGQITLIKFLNK